MSRDGVSTSHFTGVRVLRGDCREVLATLPDESVNCCVTSPPYWDQRDYGVAGQLGLEPTPEDYVETMVAVFREVRRVLRQDGTAWVNLGDTFAGARGGGQGKNGRLAERAASIRGVRERSHSRLPPGVKPKDLIGIPWMVAFALRNDGWWLRSDIVWSKPCPMPESVEDRPTRAHEFIFLLSKSQHYYYDADAIRTPLTEKTRTTFGTTRLTKGGDALGKVRADNWATSVPERKPRLNDKGEEVGANKRSVWTVATQPFDGAHFATFPPRLIEPCILAGCPAGGVVLDPFGGAGTTGLVADRLGRRALLIELNPEYAEMAEKRVRDDAPLFNGAASNG